VNRKEERNSNFPLSYNFQHFGETAMQQQTVWSIIGMVCALISDFASLVAFIFSGLIFVITIIKGFTKKDIFRTRRLLEPVILGLLIGCVGFIAKLFDNSLPNGFIFQFDQTVIGMLLFISILMLASSIVLSRIASKA
jgi:hypothetical protein